LERLGFDAAFPFLDLSTAQSKESGVKAKALQRLPPILMSNLNAGGAKRGADCIAPTDEDAMIGWHVGFRYTSSNQCRLEDRIR
jgi:hypothetical protein